MCSMLLTNMHESLMLGLHFGLIVASTRSAVSAEMHCCFQSIKGNSFISYAYNINIIYDSFLYSNIIFTLILLSNPIR